MDWRAMASAPKWLLLLPTTPNMRLYNPTCCGVMLL
jgi:hypothetical protein